MKAFTDIQVEFVIRDESNRLSFDIGKDGRTVYLSKVFNPSYVLYNNNTDFSLLYRSIEIDLTNEVRMFCDLHLRQPGGGVLANYIRIQKNTAVGKSRLRIADIDVHAAIPSMKFEIGCAQFLS